MQGSISSFQRKSLGAIAFLGFFPVASERRVFAGMHYNRYYNEQKLQMFPHGPLFCYLVVFAFVSSLYLAVDHFH
uniref:Uncharacterized protein n=1 Tax=Rhizophora mucronata TaxID=61149 RepID=A0A2P2NYW7_RHIMU